MVVRSYDLAGNKDVMSDGMERMKLAQEEAIRQRLEEVTKAQKTLDRAQQTMGLIAQPGWEHFVAWLKDLQDAAVTQLRQAKEIGDLRAFQAQANLIDNILAYPDIVKREAAEAATVASDFGARA